MSLAQAQAARFEWEEGERRLARLDPAERAQCERVIDAVRTELRRRLGGEFTVAELAREYAGAHAWFLPVALDAVIRPSAAHDGAVTLDAAFARFMRGAVDVGLW